MEDEERTPFFAPSRVNAVEDVVDSMQRKKNAVIAILSVLVVASVAVIFVLLSQETIAPISTEKIRLAKQDDLSISIRSAMGEADPCDEFYKYACGGWLDSATIPPDKNAWSRSFSVIHERSLSQLREILEENDKSLEGRFFNSCMDESAVNQKGFGAIQPLFDLIESQLSQQGAFLLSASLMREGISLLTSVGVEVDVKHPNEHILTVSQGGLGLPDRQYYFDDDQSVIRDQYVAHVTKVLNMTGSYPDITAVTSLAQGVLAFEKRLAQVSLKRDEMRDPEKLYNNKTLDQLNNEITSLDWTHYFLTALGNDADISGDTEINLSTPLFFSSLASIINQTSMDHIKAYFRFHTVHSYSSVLHDEMRAATFEFYGHQLSGQEQQPPRWKKCVAMTDDNLGDALGKTYSDLHFTQDDKAAAKALIQRVEDALKHRLSTIRWMDNVTREATEEKLSKISNNVGFPERWISYADLNTKIGPDLFENEKFSRQFDISRQFKKIGKSVDRDEWDMTAPTVNAYYDPSKNKMVFPAGILQLPFFDRTAPAAINYGAIGAVMGHELTHAFDDEGRKFDGEGKLRDWWAPDAIAKFDSEAKCVENQFNEFIVPGTTDTKLNGHLTLGENIADLGGVKSAYYAFQQYKATRRQQQAANDHPASLKFLSEDQLFFVSYAQAWCELVRPQYSQVLAKTDPHSPPQYRVQGPLSNFDAFSEAFKCNRDTKYHRKADDRCQVW